MTYRWLRDMDQALAAHGIPYVEEGDWRNNGRPASDFQFNPQGVLCHHTASPAGTSDRTDINVILAGNSSAPGPISQIYIGRSATCYLLAAGRANHGGKGIRPGWDSSCQDMNELLIGIEVGNNGVGEVWPDPQTTIYGQVVNALCEWYGWDIWSQVFLHATTGPPNQGCNSKIDPAGPWQWQPNIGASTWNLDTWRQFCVEQGGGTPTPPGDEDMAYVIYESKDAAGNRWAWADFLGLEAGGLCESVVWISGDYKAQIEQSGANVQHKPRAWGGYKTFRLEGGMPQGDQQYAWSDQPGVDFRVVDR
jgi:hypothetical protein